MSSVLLHSAAPSPSTLSPGARLRLSRAGGHQRRGCGHHGDTTLALEERDAVFPFPFLPLEKGFAGTHHPLSVARNIMCHPTRPPPALAPHEILSLCSPRCCRLQLLSARAGRAAKPGLSLPSPRTYPQQEHCAGGSRDNAEADGVAGAGMFPAAAECRVQGCWPPLPPRNQPGPWGGSPVG